MEPQAKLDPITEIALRSMKDIALPQPVSWFPQTWGWALLAAVVVLVLLIWLFLALRRYQRNAYRREAMRLLGDIEQDMRDPAALQKNLQALAELLKRTALAAWPREKVARVTGRDWITVLDASEEKEIGRALSRLLKVTEYRGDVAGAALSRTDIGDILQDARRWIAGHHVPV